MINVSVVIPIYNVEAYLKECLQSVCSQTLNNIEIICVDDASNDNSPAIIDEFASQYSQIKVIHLLQNGGAANARNIGIKHAVGKYLMFLDGDDYLYPDSCRKAFELIEKSKTDIVNFNCSCLYNGTVYKEIFYLVPFNGVIEGESLIDPCFKDRKFTHSLVNKIYRTSILKEAVEFMTSERLDGGEDYYQFFIIAFFCRSYCGVPGETLYNYRAMVGRDSKNKCFVFYSMGLIPYMKEFLAAIGASDKYLKTVELIRQEIYNECLKRLLSNLLDRDFLEIAVKYCGYEILIDFIEAMGACSVKNINYADIIPKLLMIVQEKDVEIAQLSLGNKKNSNKSKYSFVAPEIKI